MVMNRWAGDFTYAIPQILVSAIVMDGCMDGWVNGWMDGWMVG
jgi:hypothetical protein